MPHSSFEKFVFVSTTYVEILHKTTITIERKGEECIKNKIETLSIGTTRQIHKNNSQKDRQMKANQNQKHIYIYIYIYIYY
jgi:hypothetical protein